MTNIPMEEKIKQLENSLAKFKELKAKERRNQNQYPEFAVNFFGKMIEYLENSIGEMVSRLSNLNKEPKVVFSASVKYKDEKGSYVSMRGPKASSLSKNKVKKDEKITDKVHEKLFTYSLDSKLIYPYKMIWASGDIGMMKDVIRSYLLMAGGDNSYISRGGTSNALLAVAAHEMTHINNIHTFDEDLIEMALTTNLDYVTNEVQKNPDNVSDLIKYSNFISFLKQRLQKSLLFKFYFRKDAYVKSIAEMEASLSMLWISILTFMVQLKVWIDINYDLTFQSRSRKLPEFIIELIKNKSSVGSKEELVKRVMNFLGSHYLASEGSVENSVAWRIATEAIKNIKESKLSASLFGPLSKYGDQRYGVFFIIEKILSPGFITYPTFMDFIASFSERIANYILKEEKVREIETNLGTKENEAYKNAISLIGNEARETLLDLVLDSMVDMKGWLYYASSYYGHFKKINVYLIAAAKIFKILARRDFSKENIEVLKSLNDLFAHFNFVHIDKVKHKTAVLSRKNAEEDAYRIREIIEGISRKIEQEASKGGESKMKPVDSKYISLCDMPIAGFLSSEVFIRFIQSLRGQDKELLSKLKDYINERLDETQFFQLGLRRVPAEVKYLRSLALDAIFNKEEITKITQQLASNTFDFIKKQKSTYNAISTIGAYRKFIFNYDLVIDVVKEAFPDVVVGNRNITKILIESIEESKPSTGGDRKTLLPHELPHAGLSLLTTWAFIDISFKSISSLFKNFLNIVKTFLDKSNISGNYGESYESLKERFIRIMNVYLDDNNSGVAAYSDEEQEFAFRNKSLMLYKNIDNADKKYIEANVTANVYRSCALGFNISDNGNLMYQTTYDYILFGSLIAGIRLVCDNEDEM